MANIPRPPAVTGGTSSGPVDVLRAPADPRPQIYTNRPPSEHAQQLVRWWGGAFGAEKPMLCAEVGVLAGRTSDHLLRELPKLFLLMVDYYQCYDPLKASRYFGPNQEQQRLGEGAIVNRAVQLRHAYVRTSDLAERRTIIVTSSGVAAHLLRGLRGTLDAVFVDASHVEEDVYDDLTAWAPLVRLGGLVCGHDWESPVGAGVWGVREAVERYRRDVGETSDLVLGDGCTYQWRQTREGG